MADPSPPGPHPERGRLSALRRLIPFARPYRGLIALTFGAALVATLAQLTVPLVTAAIVDGPLAHGDRAGLWPLEEPAIFAPAKELDREMFRRGLPHAGRAGERLLSAVGGMVVALALPFVR